MKLVKKLVLALVLIMAAAPVVGLADSPFPCPSCTPPATK